MPEGVLAVVMLWLPAITITAAKLSHGGVAERYMLPTVLGAALTVGYATHRVSAQRRPFSWVLSFSYTVCPSSLPWWAF